MDLGIQLLYGVTFTLFFHKLNVIKLLNLNENIIFFDMYNMFECVESKFLEND